MFYLNVEFLATIVSYNFYDVNFYILPKITLGKFSHFLILVLEMNFLSKIFLILQTVTFLQSVAYNGEPKTKVPAKNKTNNLFTNVPQTKKCWETLV